MGTVSSDYMKEGGPNSCPTWKKIFAIVNYEL